MIVDPKDRDFSIYANANVITPNQKELFEATEPDLNVSDYSIVKLSKKIIKQYGFDTVITTRSSDGISVVNKNTKILHLPSRAKEVFDVSGAGDTVVSYIASGIVRKLSLTDSVKEANEAAGIAVGTKQHTVDNSAVDGELLMYEAFYSYNINDGMTVTPLVYIKEFPSGTTDETGLMVKTSFSF